MDTKLRRETTTKEEGQRDRRQIYWSADKGNRYRSFVEVKRSLLSVEFMDQQVLASDAGSVEVEQPVAALTKSPNQADKVIAYEAI